MHNFSGLLNHRKLVISHRHGGCLECRNIRRLADGVREKSHRDTGLEITHLNLTFYRRIPLQPCHSDQIHIIKCQLTQLRNLGLNQQCGFCGIQTAGHIIQRHFNNILSDLLRILYIVRQRLGIRYHDENLIIFPGIL